VSEPLPLSDAQRRLRRPGRPQKTSPAPELDERAVLAAGCLPPRLLDINSCAVYLAVSPWTVRDLVANGTLRRVRIPLPGHGELRRVLLDREDLDRLIGQWKDATP
jgi:hypothetical protein